MANITLVRSTDSWDGLDGITNTCAVQVLTDTYRFTGDIIRGIEATADGHNEFTVYPGNLLYKYLTEVTNIMDPEYITFKRGLKNKAVWYCQAISF